MNPIACKLGPTTVSVGGDAYTFARDEYGRFVAEVEDLRHRSCLLSVEHYHEVERHPPIAPVDSDPGETELPAFLHGHSGAGAAAQNDGNAPAEAAEKTGKRK